MLKLAIGNTIRFPVRIRLNDAGKTRDFSFHLLGKRKQAEELRDLQADPDALIDDLLVECITGWEDQTLVLDDSGKPAPWSVDAFRTLLTLPGVSLQIMVDYYEANGAKGKEKNSGR